MILYINTTQGQMIEIAVLDSDKVSGKDNNKVIAQKKFLAQYCQVEKLLPQIEKMLKQKKLTLEKMKKIYVANQGGSPDAKVGTSFTALRIGVVTANALGFALAVPVKSEVESRKLKFESRKFDFDIVEPIYDKKPNVT